MMYYQPPSATYSIVSNNNSFLSPRNRHCRMTTAYCDGGPELFNSKAGITGYVWVAFVDSIDNITVKREDSDEKYVVTTRANVSQLDLTFDQNMRPFLTYVVDDIPYYFHFNSHDSSYSEVALDTSIRFPRCELDMRDVQDIPNSDIILGYIRDGNLCYRVQRERFLQEHIIATDSNKTMLWRIGRLLDGRFGYHWR